VTKKKAKKMGRPLSYTEAIGNKICDMLAEGKSLTSILKERGMPTYQTAMRWVSRLPHFQHQYARAREVGYMILAEGLIDCCSDDTRDSKHKAIEVDTRKWILSKMLPKIYGSKQTVDMQVEQTEAKAMTPLEISTRMQHLIRLAQGRVDEGTLEITDDTDTETTR